MNINNSMLEDEYKYKIDIKVPDDEFALYIPTEGTNRIPMKLSNLIDIMRKWCIINCIGRIHIEPKYWEFFTHGCKIYFEEEQDAVLFSLSFDINNINEEVIKGLING